MFTLNLINMHLFILGVSLVMVHDNTILTWSVTPRIKQNFGEVRGQGFEKNPDVTGKHTQKYTLRWNQLTRMFSNVNVANGIIWLRNVGNE